MSRAEAAGDMAVIRGKVTPTIRLAYISESCTITIIVIGKQWRVQGNLPYPIDAENLHSFASCIKIHVSVNKKGFIMTQNPHRPRSPPKKTNLFSLCHTRAPC